MCSVAERATPIVTQFTQSMSSQRSRVSTAESLHDQPKVTLDCINTKAEVSHSFSYIIVHVNINSLCYTLIPFIYDDIIRGTTLLSHANCSSLKQVMIGSTLVVTSVMENQSR